MVVPFIGGPGWPLLGSRRRDREHGRGGWLREDRRGAWIPIVAEHESRIAVVLDGRRVVRLFELARAGQSPTDVDGLAVGGVAVEFPEMDLGRIGGGARERPWNCHATAPTAGLSTQSSSTTSLAGNRLGANAREIVVLDVRRAVERTAQVDVAVIRVGIADLRVVGAGTERAAVQFSKKHGPRPHMKSTSPSM